MMIGCHYCGMYHNVDEICSHEEAHDSTCHEIGCPNA